MTLYGIPRMRSSNIGKEYKEFTQEDTLLSPFLQRDNILFMSLQLVYRRLSMKTQ
jgi:hypothetical protein